MGQRIFQSAIPGAMHCRDINENHKGGSEVTFAHFKLNFLHTCSYSLIHFIVSEQPVKQSTTVKSYENVHHYETVNHSDI